MKLNKTNNRIFFNILPFPSGKVWQFSNSLKSKNSLNNSLFFEYYRDKEGGATKYKKVVIKNYKINYIKITKLFLIILLSEYLSNFIKNFIISENIQINIKLVHKLENNINILGKYLSKELINNPRQFKNLFKKYIKND